MIDNASAHALFPWMEQISLRLTPRIETAPALAACRGRCVGTSGWGAPRGKVGQQKALALGYELGRLFTAVAFGVLQTLVLSLRIADSLGQHLAQFSLGLGGFTLGCLPLGHDRYVGMQQRDLNLC
jgi:hypothetical protein